MKKYILIVIAVVVTFLALIVAYTMTPPDTPASGSASPPAAKH